MPSKKTLLFSLLCALAALGCGTSTRERPPFAEGGGNGGAGGASGCEEGEVADCKIVVEQASGVTSCWMGKKKCEEGVWSKCEVEIGGATSAGFSSSRSFSLALSLAPIGCGTSCDPSCQSYTDTPTAGTGGGSSTIPDFSTPSKTVCEHSFCSVGNALVATCHPCAAKVCSTNPECCTDLGVGDEWTTACSTKAQAVCPSSPTPEVGPGSCDGISAYVNGTYTSGAKVTYGGSSYQCVSNAFSAYCGNSSYLPGTTNGSLCWTLLGACTAGASCPINRSLEAVPPPRLEPCETGLDCQVNTRCDDVSTDSTCSHSKCVVGTALSASCDTCVSRICAANPGCCTDDGNVATHEWSSTCIGLIATKCDAKCGTSAGAACSHQLCTTGANLTSTCDPCATKVCGTPGFEYCCAGPGTWDNFCVDQVKRSCTTPTTQVLGTGNNLCDYALLGAGALAVYSADIKGGDVGGGTGSNKISAATSADPRPQITGNVYSQGAMAISWSDLAKKALSGGTISGCSDLVAGTCLSGTTVPSASAITRSFSCTTGTTNLTGTTTLASGSYGDVTIAPGAHVTFGAGPLRVASLTVGNGAVIELPGSGTVYLESCGAVAFGQSVTMAGVSGASDAFRLNLYANGNVSIDKSSVLYAIIQAPTKDVTLKSGTSSAKTTLYGLVHSTTTTLNKYSEINASGLTGQACVNAGINIVPGACPVNVGATAPPPGTGVCTTNASGYQDSASTTFDLAIDYTCGSPMRVCNHGTSPAPSGTVLSFFPRSSQQFAVESADTNFLLGTCTVSSAIPAGGCVSETCSASLFADDAFVVINGKGLSGSVAEFSYLDNWSLYSKTASCSSPTGSSVYEATCPTNTSPRWGLLTFQTTTPGASSVQFDTRVAATNAGLASATYVATKTAQTALGTTNCPKSGVSGCPVDLTLTHGLGGSQPSFLELRYTAVPDGSNTPSITKWEVTYSCVDDQ